MNNKREKDEGNHVDKFDVSEGQIFGKNPSLFPSSIERLLLKAASETNLKKDLLENKDSVIENPELLLTSQDKIILKNIPPGRLNDMIEKFSHQRTSRRTFIKEAALSAALLTTGIVLSSDMPFNYRKPPSVHYYSTHGNRPDTEPPPEPRVIKRKTGPEGAVINLARTGLALTIPEGALDKSVEITIEALPKNYVYKFYLPEEFSNKNNISYFLPHKFAPKNIDFLKEIIIDFYFLGRCKIFSEVNGYCLTEDNAAGNPHRSERLSVDVTKDNRTIMKTKKFGVYAIGTVRKSAIPIVPEMILISSSHRHIKSFYIARHEVTYKEYYRYCKVYSDVEQPVVHISWYGAIKYCNWLTLNTPGFTEEDCCYSGIPPDVRTDRYKKGYRLPSEDEWKYVLSKEPKSLGLYDIKLEPFMRCSQVYEWADNDRYYRYWTYNISGGCWGTFEPDDDRWYNIGFRLARTADT